MSNATATAATTTGDPGTERPRWIAPAGLAVSAAGLAVSAYLTIAHYTTTGTLACPATATVNCEKVTTSPESVILGVPVALLGLLYFAATALLALPVLWRRPDPWLRAGRLALTVVGLGLVARLVYAELFEIDAICLWCTVVHVLAFAMFAITALGTAATTTVPEPAARPRPRRTPA